MKKKTGIIKEVNMKQKTFLYGFCLTFAVLALCSLNLSASKVVQSDWLAAPLTIDGSSGDWEGVTFATYKRTEVDYAFRNDSENLYVLFVFRNPREFMSSIRDTGMTLYLSTEGKNKKDYGIRFQVKTVSADDYIVLLEQMLEEPMPEEKKSAIRAKQKAYPVFHNEVISKDEELPPLTTGPNAPSFNYAGRDAITYEFKIPLKKDEAHPVGIGTEPGNEIRIGFEWGGSSKESRQEKLKSQTASGTAGRAESGTGSLAGERGVAGASLKGGLGTMSRLRAAKYIFWTDVKLADKQ